MDSPDISSPGFRSALPAGTTLKFGTSGTGVTTSGISAEPDSTVARPLHVFSPKVRETPPLRRSASTRQVGPRIASAIARFEAMVVLPSLGDPETTSITCGGLPPWECIRFGRARIIQQELRN